MNSDELKELRKRFHWSQEETANRLGCSKRSISNWEKGTHKIPDSIALAAAAVCMNIPKYGKDKK